MTIRLHLEPSDVLDFADGTVDPSQRDALERHLSNCAQCRALVVESLRDDEVTAPAGPSRVGRFIIHGRLGVGAMGMVFDATDPHLERRVALKICKGSGVTINQRRVLDEARTMARLNHPNVVCVYEAGFSGDEVFLVMERVGGGTLLEFVRQHAEQTDRLIALFLEAGAGLAAAHRAGVVHRDFKPENVLIDQYGHAKVTDFGLATSAPERVLAGTPSYLAPEVLRGGVATPASDQFSFCVALFEALAGRHPSRTRTLPVWCADRATRRALDRGLSVDPCDRFESMDALLDALGAGRQRRERLATLSLGLSGLVSWVIGG